MAACWCGVPLTPEVLRCSLKVSSKEADKLMSLNMPSSLDVNWHPQSFYVHVCSTRGEAGAMGAQQHTHHRETDRQTGRHIQTCMIRLANTCTHRRTDIQTNITGGYCRGPLLQAYLHAQRDGWTNTCTARTFNREIIPFSASSEIDLFKRSRFAKCCL